MPRLGVVIPVEERFWEKVNLNLFTGCWEWQASLVTGYGRFWTDEKKHLSHRWAYETYVGSIPEGFEIDHLCRNRRCVNVGHMDIVTR